ncbi:MAG: PAS domain-containing protein, partial [Bacteroidales bacterium]|nr:PAS domain-containing protein [Bacteroidales bacterium]
MTILAGYVVFLFTDLHSDSFTWHVIVHAGSMGIGAYGIYNGWKMIRSSRVSGIVFTSSMVIFLLFLINEIMATHLGFALIPWIGGFLQPLDFYPMLFIVIMTGVLLQDLAMKYHLQKQVTQKDKKWATLMDNVGLLVIELNPEGKIAYANSHYENLTGYTRKEVLGKSWFDLMIAAEDRKMLVDVFREELEKDIWSEYQNRIITKNGLSLIINWSNLPTRDEDGEIVGVLCIGFDQTRQQEQMNEI